VFKVVCGSFVIALLTP
ncbi:TPA: DUF3265 domain-containing protein, partial [Vibrio vulnificus]|nr:DUF3265 domain-containing protein [Vibrio vulnificus]HDZ3727934.1 DUF3265 domain-containing protein [Vibrio vulnificus]